MKWILFLLSCLSCFGQFEIDRGTIGLSVSALGSSAATANDDNQATASYNPRGNSMLIAIVVNTKAASPDQPTVSGNSLVWNEIFDTNYLTDHRLTIWQAKCGTGATVGAFTATTTGVSQTGWAVAVIEIVGGVNTGTDGTNVLRQRVNANVSAGTTITATFGALGTRTLCIGLVGGNLNGTANTAESGWTELTDINFNTPATELTIVYQAKNADTTCAVSNASSFSGCIVGLEFVQEGAYP